MHLLQSGVEIAVIALWLGHESLDTTHMYIQADLKTKEQALGKTVLCPPRPRYSPEREGLHKNWSGALLGDAVRAVSERATPLPSLATIAPFANAPGFTLARAVLLAAAISFSFP